MATARAATVLDVPELSLQPYVCLCHPLSFSLCFRPRSLDPNPHHTASRKPQATTLLTLPATREPAPQPDNCLMESPGAGSPLKVADWGFSQFLRQGRKLRGRVGTCFYMAPVRARGRWGGGLVVMNATARGFLRCTPCRGGATLEPSVGAGSQGPLIPHAHAPSGPGPAVCRSFP